MYKVQPLPSQNFKPPVLRQVKAFSSPCLPLLSEIPVRPNTDILPALHSIDIAPIAENLNHSAHFNTTPLNTSARDEYVDIQESIFFQVNYNYIVFGAAAVAGVATGGGLLYAGYTAVQVVAAGFTVISTGLSYYHLGSLVEAVGYRAADAGFYNAGLRISEFGHAISFTGMTIGSFGAGILFTGYIAGYLQASEPSGVLIALESPNPTVVLYENTLVPFGQSVSPVGEHVISLIEECPNPVPIADTGIPPSSTSSLWLGVSDMSSPSPSSFPMTPPPATSPGSMVEGTPGPSSLFSSPEPASSPAPAPVEFLKVQYKIQVSHQRSAARGTIEVPAFLAELTIHGNAPSVGYSYNAVEVVSTRSYAHHHIVGVYEHNKRVTGVLTKVCGVAGCKAIPNGVTTFSVKHGGVVSTEDLTHKAFDSKSIEVLLGGEVGGVHTES